MKKYLFITYGEAGWRGVQIKALRIASYFKKEEVLFWNFYDTTFIKQYGFEVEEKVSQLYDPKDIVFPDSIEVVIFADIPSNEAFSYAAFIQAKRKDLKIVMLEDYYRRGQYKEAVFNRFANQSDLFLFTSLSKITEKTPQHVRFVPPRIEYSFSKSTRREVCKEYNIPEESIILFGAGYHSVAFKNIIDLSQQLSHKHKNVYTVLFSPDLDTKLQRNNNLTILPFDNTDTYFKLLFASDIVLVKFGFNQIMEALCFYKPVVVVGDAGYVLQKADALDKEIKKVVFFDALSNNNVYSYILKLIEDKDFYTEIVSSIKKLHNGETHGAQKTYTEIIKLRSNLISFKNKKEVSFLPSQEHKNLVILVNNEIFEKEAFLKTQENVYVLGFIMAMPTKKEVLKRVPKHVLEKTIQDCIVQRTDELLPHSFKEIVILSQRKLDGLTDIGNWYEEWIEHIKQLLLSSDRIYITKQGEKIVGKLITGLNIHKKVTTLP